MDYIFYLVVFWAIIRWIYNFFIKFVWEKWYNTSNILFLISVFFILFSLISILIVWWNIINIKFFIFYAFLHSLFYFFWSYFNYNWQKLVPAYIYYSISRLRPIILIFVSIIFFHENITTNQTLWIILTVISWMFIFKKDDNLIKHINYNLWIFFSILALLFYTVSVSVYKIWLWYSDVFFFLLATHIFILIISQITRKIEKKDLWINKNLTHFDYIFISLFLSSLLFIADVIYAYGLINLNISIVSALSIISTFIPILFAFMFFKEKLSISKIIALIIMLFSIYLFK